MKVTLETNRLILRPFEANDDVAIFNNWASDPEVTKYLTWNHHEDIKQTREILSIWIKQYEKPERINFGIVLKETNELIGGIDVVGYIEGVPVIGYCLSRKYWNNGYVTEAFKRVIEFLFSLNHSIIRVDALVENIASNKVILKCGGKYVNTYEEFRPSKNKTDKINSYIIKK